MFPKGTILCWILTLSLTGCISLTADTAPSSSSTPYTPEVAIVADGKVTPAISSGLTATGARDFSLPPRTDLPLVRAESPITNQIYTLPDLIDLAQMNNPQTRIAWDMARQNAALVGMARSAYLPMISATVIGGYQKQGSGSTVANVLSTSSSQDTNGTVSTASLSWLLFDFGGRDASLASARSTLESSNISFNGAHQKIISDVSRQFFDYSSARQVVALTLKTRDESAYLFKSAQSRFDQGMDSAVSLAQSRSTLAQAELDLVNARGSERESYNSLISAVGISPMIRLHIQDVSARPLPPAPPPSVMRIVQNALHKRYDIQSGLASLRSAEAGVVSAQADFLPKVFMSASGTYVTGNLNISSLPSAPGSSGAAPGTSFNNRNVSVLGGVSIPIFDGGMRDASLQSARAKVDSSASAVILLQQNAAKEIVSAYDALRSSIASYRAADTLVQASIISKNAAFAAYMSGNGSLTSAVDAEKSLQSARMSMEKAHGTALIAASSLAFSAGSLTSSDAVLNNDLLRSPL